MDQLTEEMRQVLFALWLLPWGGTQNWDKTGAGGVPASRPPAGVRLDGSSERLPHEYWQAKWDRAISTVRKEVVLKAAQEDLARWRTAPKGPRKEESSEQEDRRILEEGEGWSVGDVARHFKCTPTRVRLVRATAGAKTTTGKLPEVPKLPRDERAEKVRRMRSEGLSLRQIGMILDCGKMTVRRDLVA
jgi:hypothetical protein